MSVFPPLDFIPRSPIRFDDRVTAPREDIEISDNGSTYGLHVVHRPHNRMCRRVSHRRSGRWGYCENLLTINCTVHGLFHAGHVVACR